MRRYLRGCAGAGAGDGDIFSPNLHRRTPDHPPYSEMVNVALRALAEENGSTESSISAYIQSTFNDLPWGHNRLLPYYLRKLVAAGELTSPSPDCYQLTLHPSPLPSTPPRRRGRPPKIFAEGTPSLHLGQETPPLQRGRGRLRLRRDDAIGRTATRRLVVRFSRSRGSKRTQNSFLVSNMEGLNCQSGISAFCDDIENGGSESGVLKDPEHIELGHAQPGEGQPFVYPEQSEHGKRQFLRGEEPPLLIPEPEKIPPFLAPEHYEHGKGQPLVPPQQTEFSQDQSSLGEKLPLLTPESGKVLPFLTPELFEHDQGHSTQREAPPFEAPEQTELGQDQSSPKERQPLLTPEPGKVLAFLAPEFFEHDQRQPAQGEAQPFMSPEQTELRQKQSSEGQTLLCLEQPEHDHGLPLAAPEEFEDDHEQRLPGEGMAAPNEGELVLMPHPDGEEVEHAAVSSKKRKSQGKRRRLRLWFEAY